RLEAVAAADRTDENEERYRGGVERIGGQEEIEAPAAEQEAEGTRADDRPSQVPPHLLVARHAAPPHVPCRTARRDNRYQRERRDEADGPSITVGRDEREEQDVEEHQRVHQRNLPYEARILL